MEVWKDVVGYEGDYRVSSYGRVQTLKTAKTRFLTPQQDAQGYLHVRLAKNGVFKLYKMHRLVAAHFLPGESQKSVVNHLDRDRRNNHVLNLEWCTAGENQYHSWYERLTISDLLEGRVVNPLDYL